MKRRFIVISLTAFMPSLHPLIAQSELSSQSSASSQNSASSQQVVLPDLKLPSPKATMIDRFGQYPTNLYTGLIDITIPIFTIQEKNLTIPIEFKYHASGLKYDDLPMELGYGWTLMAGGAVTYFRRGQGVYPPGGTQFAPFIKQVSDIERYGDNPYGYASAPDQEQLDRIINGQKGPYDSVSEYCDSEYDVYNFTLPNYYAQYYQLEGIDSKNFSVPTSTWWFHGGPSPYAIDGYGNIYNFSVSDNEMSGNTFTKYLTKIACAGSHSEINFKYKTLSVGESNDSYRTIIGDYVRIQRLHKFTGDIAPHVEPFFVSGNVYSKEYRCPLLQEIKYRGGKIVFSYSPSRTHSLRQIDIYGTGGLIRTVKLVKTDEKYLDSVEFYDGSGHKTYSYEFEYDGKKPEDLRGVDYWGYYNSPTKPAVYVPNFQVQTGTSSNRLTNTDRNSNEQFMKKGSLKKITYPTKGYSIFEFEANQSNGKTYGGLRIKEFRNYSEDGTLLETHRYKYGINEDGNGRVVRTVDPNDYLSKFREILTQNGGHSGILYDLETLTYSSFPKCSYFTQGSPVVYSVITEYVGKEGESEGKIRYTYTDVENQYYDSTIRGLSMEFPKWSYEWKSGKLLSKEIYNSNGITVYSLENSYKEINREDHLNLSVSEYFAKDSHSPAELTNPNWRQWFGGTLYDYYNYYVTSGEYAVWKTKETIERATKTTTYDDFNDLGQARTITTIESSGDTRVTRLTYPYDLEREGGHPIYNNMYDSNVLEPIVEQKVYKGNQLLSHQVNEYVSNPFAPKYLKEFNGTGMDTRIIYSYDAKGNVRSAVKDGLESVFYIWGQNGLFPVAEIRGASATEVESILGADLFETLLTTPNVPTTQMEAIEALRNNDALKDCLITTMYYDSWNHLGRIIGPNGQVTSYGYDDFGRLSYIKDHNGHIVETYEYDYKQ